MVKVYTAGTTAVLYMLDILIIVHSPVMLIIHLVGIMEAVYTADILIAVYTEVIISEIYMTGMAAFIAVRQPIAMLFL